MTPLTPDNHSGVWAFTGGLVVLVMAGMALSLMVDKRNAGTSKHRTIERQIAHDREEVEELEYKVAEKSRRLASLGPQETSRKALATELELTAPKVALLNESVLQLKDDIRKIDSEFANRRASYRRKTWASAVGEKLGNVVLRGGREYQDAVITRVTEVGIEIRHSDGIARIQAPDLPTSFGDRFQWNDEERRAKLREEQEQMKLASEPTEELPEKALTIAVPNKTSPREARINAEEKVLDPLRAKVISWQGKVDSLSTELGNAESQATYGNQASVRGSLETWHAKSNRLRGELLKATAELATARTRLAAVAPNDPLTRVEEPAP